MQKLLPVQLLNLFKQVLPCYNNIFIGFTLIPMLASYHHVMAQNPGKVGTANLTAWFKPDSLPAGDVLSWQSSFPNGPNTITFTDTTGAPYPKATDTSNGVLNYNNVISFADNSATNILTLGRLGTVNYLNNNTSTGIGTLIMVYYLPSFTATGGHMMSYRESGGDGIQYRHLGTVTRCAIGTTASVNACRDYTEDYKPMLFSYTGNKSGAATMKVYKRSLLITNAVSSASTGDNGVFIGARRNTSTWSGFYEGYIGECIFYNINLSGPDLAKVNSYLALKYGITLDNTGGGIQGDYVTPNGTLLWDASNNPSYHNNIIGIAREDGEGLYQKQSHTIDDSTRVYLGTLGINNKSNSIAISNDSSYLIIGSNTGQLSATLATNAEVPTGVSSRLEREWKISNVNFINYFNVDILLDSKANSLPININDLCLLVDNDGDFSNATAYNSSSGITFGYLNGVLTAYNLSFLNFPIDSVRYFTIGSTNPSTQLPVKIVAFSATRFNHYVALNWSTASEINNDYFTVERNIETHHWEDIGEVDAAGNSARLVNYSFNDLNPLSTTTYYRIKQTDLDGTHTYSPTIAINPDRVEEEVLVVYPTLTNKQLTASISPQTSFSIYNTFGQDLTAKVQVIQTAENKLVLDVSALASGNYFLLTRHGKAVFVKSW